jgi:hypothetical protein
LSGKAFSNWKLKSPETFTQLGLYGFLELTRQQVYSLEVNVKLDSETPGE